MSSTFTDRNRLTKQGIGENESTWGDILNTVIDLVDEALDGVLDVDVSAGNVTLTANNGSDDEARNRVLRISGEPGANRTITIPDTQKIYYVDVQVSGSANVTIKNVADTTGVVVSAASENIVIMCDGVSTKALIRPPEALIPDNNLSDVANVSASRINLGLGDAAQLSVSDLQDFFYPVGSLYFNAESSTNPATLLGFGTWVAYAKGRAIVGVGTGTDENGVNFTVSAGAEWGEYEHTQSIAEMPNHKHSYDRRPNPVYNADEFSTGGFSRGQNTGASTGSTGGGQAMNWSQPSIGIYIWRRTS